MNNNGEGGKDMLKQGNAPEAPATSDVVSTNSASANSTSAETPSSSTSESSAQGGIFSTSDTRIETENLPENVQAPFAAAPASAITPTLRTESTVTGDLKLGSNERKGKKWLVIAAGAVVLVGIVVIVTLLLGGRTPSIKNEIGSVNLNYLFDETAPIPAEQDGQFGYIDPENGSWIITPQYLSASSFYGDYATVSYSQANEQKVAIIDRNGDTKVVQEGDSIDAYYDIDNNIWVVGGDIYDSSLTKLNADGVTGNYIGNGYILSSSKIEKNVDDNQGSSSNSDEPSEEGSTSLPSSTAAGGNTYTETIGKIEDLKGNVRYDCRALCAANTTNDGKGNVYAVVRSWGEPAKIISLPNGEVLYTASGTNKIQILHDAVFAENINNNAKKYLQAEGDKVTILSDKAENTRMTISNSGEYYVEECNGRSSILKINGETIMKCDVQAYTELPKYTYMMYQATFSKDPLFVERDDKIELVNLKDATPLQFFDLGEVMVYDNSPFFYVLSDDGNAKICNLLKGTDSCVDIEDVNADVVGFGNYFTMTSGSHTKVYNANLEMIHE